MIFRQTQQLPQVHTRLSPKNQSFSKLRTVSIFYTIVRRYVETQKLQWSARNNYSKVYNASASEIDIYFVLLRLMNMIINFSVRYYVKTIITSKKEHHAYYITFKN